MSFQQGVPITLKITSSCNRKAFLSTLLEKDATIPDRTEKSYHLFGQSGVPIFSIIFTSLWSGGFTSVFRQPLERYTECQEQDINKKNPKLTLDQTTDEMVGQNAEGSIASSTAPATIISFILHCCRERAEHAS